ncbi:Hypothetical protein R9X50_00715700 [Acrodontium crateriforme]|uniref:HRDC domain-containing protein n=1 Tax=Acrodontium crateriforme TaxID=150365 RepID=A0AAQ3MC23_9PEZI|nr:Hypothetical protein R9X50_00715700 [Acrodontium crateriforme]
MEKIDNFDSLQASISSALVSTTRSAGQIANEDVSFHRSLDPTFGTSLDRQNARLLGLAERLLGSATANTEIVRPPRLSDIDAVESNWRAVVDVIDSLLERADTALDEFTGAVKRLSPGLVEQKADATKAPKTSKIAAALKNHSIEKPQLQFEHVPTNNETIPFKPLLITKPHAVVPLETSAEAAYAHPYQTEIEQYQYPDEMYTQKDPILYHPFETTTATLVDTEDAVEEMLEELKSADVIAIDLEHHDQRSYIGVVSLMQISTRDKDWIVDTLKPWRRKLSCLNEVFANPRIIKVLHGAYMDVVWLQRDLGLYLVGLFDTHYAARALGYTGGSLAFLLKKFANVDAQKQYQMADWRIRPLPQELFDYARSDTHYLLYIFDCMRNELIERSDFSKPDHEGDKIWDVLQKSSEVALQRYEHPIYDYELGQGSMGWYKMLSRTPALLSKEQFSVFRAIHQWRDNVAREDDDSNHYVMPNHQILTLAKLMPTKRSELLSAAQPITQAVRLRADELVSVIVKAIEAGENGPEMVDVLSKVEVQLPRRQTAQVAAQRPLASYLPQPPTTTAISTSNLPLRSSISTFWGNAFKSSAHQERDMSSLSQISLAIPLPPLTAEIFADPPEHQTPVQESAPPPAESPLPTPPAREDDEIFVLKEKGRKRKRTDAVPTDNMAAQTDEVALPDEEEELERERVEKKKAKKEARRARKAAEAGGFAAAADAEEDEQPFDYNAAPSVLNPPRESRQEMKERRKKEKNPYAKSMDAPKGMARGQKERAGKTMTYK